MKNTYAKIYTSYSMETDTTFIIEDTYMKDELLTVEVKGFYYGSPDEELTKKYYGKLIADFR